MTKQKTTTASRRNWCSHSLDRKIKAKEIQLQQLKKFSGYYSPSISEGPKNKSNRVSSVEETVLRICYIEECIKSQIAELTALLSKIRSVIERVNNLEYETILEMRYLSFMKWKKLPYGWISVWFMCIRFMLKH